MAYAEIKNVRKDLAGNITDVGVKDSWEWPVPQVVASIEAGTNTLYVKLPRHADVHVSKNGMRHKFLKTTADTTTKNNLNSLFPL